MQEQAREIAKKYARRVVTRTNDCTGFGVELDERGRPIFVTYVEKRRNSHRWLEKLRLDNIKVKVKEMPKMTAFAADRTIQHRPAPGGVSIGHEDITAGTLGMPVKKNGTTYILSNNHVLADSNDGDIGDDILQPGPYDGGESPDDKIGELAEYKTLFFNDPNSPNTVDAALCLPTSSSYVEDRLLEMVETAPEFYGIAHIGQKIAKSGRTTEVTRGVILAFWSGPVWYGPGKIAYYYDQIITSAEFAAGGDSGSIVITDPFRDIAYVPGEDAIIIGERGEGATLERDICTTCCGFEVSTGPRECVFCEDAGKATPNYLRVSLSDIISCDECINGAGTSYKISTFTLQGYRIVQGSKAVIGLLFAGDSAGHAVLNRMSEVVAELELDMEECPKEMQPVDMILRLDQTGYGGCTWRNWDPLKGILTFFKGYFGTVTAYDEPDCQGNTTEKSLDTLEFGVDMPVEGQAVMGGWVHSTEIVDAGPWHFFYSVIYSDCGGVGAAPNWLKCDEAPYGDFTGGSATIVPAIFYEGEPEAFPVEPDKPKLILEKAEKTPPVFTERQIDKCKRCQHIQKEGTWCGFWNITMPPPEEAVKEGKTAIRKILPGPKGPPTEEQMLKEYDLAAGGMAKAGKETVSREVYLAHRRICVDCSGGYRCPHYCCGIQAQLATPQWECRERKY